MSHCFSRLTSALLPWLHRLSASKEMVLLPIPRRMKVFSDKE